MLLCAAGQLVLLCAVLPCCCRVGTPGTIGMVSLDGTSMQRGSGRESKFYTRFPLHRLVSGTQACTCYSATLGTRPSLPSSCQKCLAKAASCRPALRPPGGPVWLRRPLPDRDQIYLPGRCSHSLPVCQSAWLLAAWEKSSAPSGMLTVGKLDSVIRNCQQLQFFSGDFAGAEAPVPPGVAF